jgi:CysZ protein
VEKRMSIWQQFVLGVKSYIQALSFIFNNGLWMYFIYPLIIGIILFFGSFSAAGYISDKLEALILGYIEPDNAEGWLGFLSGALHVFLTIGLKIIFFFIYSTFSKYITLIIMSPIMALLSERTEEINFW